MAYLRPPSAAQRIIFCSTVHGYVDPENKPVRTDRRGLRMLSSKEWLQQGASVIPAVLCLPLHVSTLITLAGRVSSYLHEHELFFHILDDGSESKVELAKECTVDSLRIDGPSTVLLRHLDIRPELLLKEDSEKTNRRAHYSPQLLVGLRAWYEAAYRELEGSEKEQRPFRCLTVWRPDEDWFTQPPPLPYAFFPAAHKALQAKLDGRQFKSLRDLCNWTNQHGILVDPENPRLVLWASGPSNAPFDRHGGYYHAPWANIVTGHVKGGARDMIPDVKKVNRRPKPELAQLLKEHLEAS